MQLKRRDLITLFGSAAAAWPLAARAQPAERMRRVGVLMGYAETDPAAQAQIAALREQLQKLGWDEGRNIRIDVRFPAADAGRVHAILMELKSLTPDVLVSNTNFVTAVVGQRAGTNQERINLLLRKARKDRIDVATGADIEDFNLLLNGQRRSPDL